MRSSLLKNRIIDMSYIACLGASFKAFVKKSTSVLLLVCLYLVACGGGSGGGGGGGSAEQLSELSKANGIWTGTIGLVSGGTGTATTVVAFNDGEFRAISDFNEFYSGTYQIAGNELSGNGNIYILDNRSVGTLTLEAIVVEQSTIRGIATTSLDTEAEVDLLYQPGIYERASSIDFVEGNWALHGVGDLAGVPFPNLVLSISSTGAVNATSSGNCLISGQISIFDPDRNLYQTEVNISGCEFSGLYTGFALNGEEFVANDLLTIAVASDDFAFAGDFLKM